MTLTREEKVVILDGLILKMEEYRETLRTSQSERTRLFTLEMLTTCNVSYAKIFKMRVE